MLAILLARQFENWTCGLICINSLHLTEMLCVSLGFYIPLLETLYLVAEMLPDSEMSWLNMQLFRLLIYLLLYEKWGDSQFSFWHALG